MLTLLPVLIRQSDFTVADTCGSGVLAGLGISRKLRPRGGNQAVVCQLLYPQIPRSAAIDPVVPWWDPFIIIVPGAICGEDQGLGGGCDASEGRQGRGRITVKEDIQGQCNILQDHWWREPLEVTFLNSLLSCVDAQPFLIQCYGSFLEGWEDGGQPTHKYPQRQDPSIQNLNSM